MSLPRIVIVTGPTATGKSRLALDLAHALDAAGRPAAIVSADSVSVYRYMDIGADKPSPAEREGVPHHLIDVVNPDESFSAAAFGEAARAIVQRSWAEGGATVVAGGTGFYLRTLREGLFVGPGAMPEVRRQLEEEGRRIGLAALHRRLAEVDPEAARRIHPHDPTRILRALEVYLVTGEPISALFARQQRSDPPYQALLIGLTMDRQRMYESINQRVTRMMERGLIAEVERLRARGYGPELKSQQALGYKQAHALLDGKLSPEEAVYLIQRDTRHFARRQLTWLRKEKGILWFPAEEAERIVAPAVNFVLTGKEPEPGLPQPRV